MKGNVVKVTLREETRRIDLGESASFDRLKALIAERFAVAIELIVVQYKDEDDDLVTISTDAELGDAVSWMAGKGPLKIFASMVDLVDTDVTFVEVEPSEDDKEKATVNDMIISDAEERKKARGTPKKKSEPISPTTPAKKFDRKSEKQSQKALLKQDLMGEIRKEMDVLRKEIMDQKPSCAASPNAYGSLEEAAFENKPKPPSAFENKPKPPCDTSMPSGEKLQELLHAFIEGIGAPADDVHKALNEMTPERVREIFSFSSLSSEGFLRFLSSVTGRVWERSSGGVWMGPSSNGTAPAAARSDVPTSPLFQTSTSIPTPPPQSPSTSHLSTPPSFLSALPSHMHRGFPLCRSLLQGGWPPLHQFGNRFGICSRSLAGQSPPSVPTTQLEISGLPPPPLVVADSGDNVRKLNRILAELGYILVSPWSSRDESNFDYITYYALMRLQGEHQLIPSGLYDEETYHVLAAKFEMPRPNSASIPAPASAPSIIATTTLVGTEGGPKDDDDEKRREQERAANEAIRLVCSFGPTGEAAVNMFTEIMATIRGDPQTDSSITSEISAAATPATVLIPTTVSLPAKSPSKVANESNASNSWADLVDMEPSAPPDAAENAAEQVTGEAQASVQPLTKYSDELMMILDMGFEDVDSIVSLLEAHKGNVNSVVEELAQLMV